MTIIDRRQLLLGSAALAAGVMAPWRGFAAQTKKTKLVLLGTQGGPNALPERGETASALIVDGRTYLVDCGYGTMGKLVRAGINYRNVPNIFLTHLHDDHVSDLAALLSHQWTGGRTMPTNVYGPHGTEDLVDAALAFQKANTEIRLVDEARSILPKDIFFGHDVPATAKPRAVFEDERANVTSVENTHYPESSKAETSQRSLAMRFDAADRTVTFSGDTNYSENVVALAKGSDVLVCEAMYVKAMRETFDRMVADGAYADNPEGVWRHIVGTHSSTETAGRMAAEAGVKMLVLNHLVPGALQDVPDDVYLEGVRKHFKGKAVVGRDLMEL